MRGRLIRMNKEARLKEGPPRVSKRRLNKEGKRLACAQDDD